MSNHVGRFMYSGNASPLTLRSAVIDTAGELDLLVSENPLALGWPVLPPEGHVIAVVVGRGTVYETKYVVSEIETQAGAGGRLLVAANDKTWDDTPVTEAPIGTLVEHCLTASEMMDLNDHVASTSAHGVYGIIADRTYVDNKGDWSDWEPVLTLNGTELTVTSARARVSRSYKRIHCYLQLTVSGTVPANSASGALSVNLPFAAIYNGGWLGGVYQIIHGGAAVGFGPVNVYATDAAMTAPDNGLQVGDVVKASFTYEAP